MKNKKLVTGLAKLIGCSAFAVPAVLVIGAAVLLSKDKEDKAVQEEETADKNDEEN